MVLRLCLRAPFKGLRPLLVGIWDNEALRAALTGLGLVFTYSEGDGSISKETRLCKLGFRSWDGPRAGDIVERNPLEAGVVSRTRHRDRVISSKGERMSANGVALPPVDAKE